MKIYITFLFLEGNMALANLILENFGVEEGNRIDDIMRKAALKMHLLYNDSDEDDADDEYGELSKADKKAKKALLQTDSRGRFVATDIDGKVFTPQGEVNLEGDHPSQKVGEPKKKRPRKPWLKGLDAKSRELNAEAGKRIAMSDAEKERQQAIKDKAERDAKIDQGYKTIDKQKNAQRLSSKFGGMKVRDIYRHLTNTGGIVESQIDEALSFGQLGSLRAAVDDLKSATEMEREYNKHKGTPDPSRVGVGILTNKDRVKLIHKAAKRAGEETGLIGVHASPIDALKGSRWDSSRKPSKRER